MSAPPVMIPIPPNIGQIIGPQLIGTLLNFFLLGILTLQTYIYHLSFPRDNPWIKVLVYFVFVFEVVQTAMNGVDAFHWFASGFGNLLKVSDPGLSVFYTPMFDGIMALIVQLFMSYRIFMLNRKVWWYSAVVACLAVTSAVGAISGGALAHNSKTVQTARDVKIQNTFIELWLISGAVCDVLIASAMAYLLLSAKRKIRMASSGDAVTQIVRLTIETNAATTAVAIVSVILERGFPTETYFITTTMILGKLYSNTLLLTFNNRTFAQKRLPQHVSSSQTSSSQGAGSKAFSGGLVFDDDDTMHTATQLSVLKQGPMGASTLGTDDRSMVSKPPQWN